MKTVVFAYHNMGITGLNALLDDGWQIQAIFSHADDPDETQWFASVSDWARINQIPVYLPDNINDPEWVALIKNLAPDVIFSFYYRKMLSPDILALPPRGAYNLHGSLLPAYRGRCPVNWVLIHGETRTGVTLHYMTEKPDAGDIIAQKETLIEEDDTAQTLFKKMCCSAAIMMAEILPRIREGSAPRYPQDLSAGSYYGGRRPEDGRIDWTWPTLRIYNLIRAVTHPYPGAFTHLPNGTKMMIWWGQPVALAHDLRPGLLEIGEGEAYIAAAGNGKIRLSEIEIAGCRLKDKEIALYLGKKEGIVLT